MRRWSPASDLSGLEGPGCGRCTVISVELEARGYGAVSLRRTCGDVGSRGAVGPYG